MATDELIPPASVPPSERTRLKRYHWLAGYEPQTVYAILDAMPLCHVGYNQDGLPYVTPTLQWREGNRIFWHGSSASRMLKSAAGCDVCLTVSLMDGVVLARSAYNFNINYRSAMLFGRAEKVEDMSAKLEHLKVMLERFVPGHWDALRPITDLELKATTVLSMPIDEASAKLRTGQAADEEEDYTFPVWAGVIPIRQEVLPVEPDPRNLAGVTAPAGLGRFSIG